MIVFRQACLNDARLLWEWRNDPQTRIMSKDLRPSTREDYLAWLTKRLARSRPNFFIVELDGHKPVGTFRIDGDKISYEIAPDSRRLGLVTDVLIEVRHKFGSLRAEIYEDNVGSIKAAARAGLDVLILRRDKP